MNVNSIVQNYEELRVKIRSYSYALSLISFDGETGAPKSGIKERSEAIGLLSLEYFNLKTGKEFVEVIDELEKVKDQLDPKMRKIVELERKNLNKIQKIPPQKYREFTELRAQSHVVWEEAKTKGDYIIFKPNLIKIVEFMKEFANYYGGPINGSLYNRLLDEYEEGMNTVKLDAFFNELKKGIVPLVKKINDKGVKVDTSFLNRKFAHHQQFEIGKNLLDLIGYNLSKGMLRESAHPFTSEISNNDIRVTTHIHEDNLLSNIYSVIHEGGHGIYEQNIADELKGTILCNGASMGIHESQSRLYENVIGRSYEFACLLNKELKKVFPRQFKDVSVDQIYKAINIVEPSFIRTEADELTYSLHIVLRYEMEKLIFDGKYDFDDLPKIWNQKMEEYLGIVPTSDKEGILQDVHWSSGLFGYFPSYALGNVYGLQILNTLRKDLDLEKVILSGDLAPIKEWLKHHVYVHGSYYSPNDLILKVTKEELNPKYFLDYLNKKYTKIYNLK